MSSNEQPPEIKSDASFMEGTSPNDRPEFLSAPLDGAETSSADDQARSPSSEHQSGQWHCIE